MISFIYTIGGGSFEKGDSSITDFRSIFCVGIDCFFSKFGYGSSSS